MLYKKLSKIIPIAAITIISAYGCTTHRPPNAPEPMASMSQAKAAYDAGNFAEAAEMLRPLAENGNADAQYSLGYLYFYGKGVPEDRAQGTFWIRKAAEQKQPLALRALQQINREEQNTPRKPVKSEPNREPSSEPKSTQKDLQ
jgi:TPR repeat protein